jgi:hypothetical protein
MRKMESFLQDQPRTITAEYRCLVFHWCYGCKRKANVHDKAPISLHMELLNAGDSVTVSVGKKHYDGHVDTCDVLELQ